MTPQKLLPYAGVLVVGLIVGAVLMHVQMKGKEGFAQAREGSGLNLRRLLPGAEGFVDVTQTDCEICHRKPHDCCASSCGGCRRPGGDPDDHRRCPTINWSKYVLRASVPPCPPQPDLSKYMLKTECPAPPDMSKYILKSAVPPCPPCISTCNKPCKIGECPPCPRPRCPTVECPPPKECPPCAPVEPPRCPEPKVTCKADYKPEEPWMVRPMLASISPM